MVRKLVDLQDEILEWMFGSSLGVKEESKLFLCHRRTTMENLKRFGYSSKYPYDSPDELAGIVLLAGVKNVSRLLRHGARHARRPSTTLEGVGGEVRVLEESRKECTNQMHGGGARSLLFEEVWLTSSQIL